MKSLQNRVWERQTLSPIAGVSPDTMKILTPQNQLRTRGVGGAVRSQEQKHERETTLQSAGLQAFVPSFENHCNFNYMIYIFISDTL